MVIEYTEITSDNIQHPFMVTVLSKLELEENSLS